MAESSNGKQKSSAARIVGILVVVVLLIAAIAFLGRNTKTYKNVKNYIPLGPGVTEKAPAKKADDILGSVDLTKNADTKKPAKASVKPAKKAEKVKVTVEDGDTTGDEEQVDLEDGTVGEVSLADYEDSLADMSKKELRAEKKKVKAALADMKKAISEEGYVSSGPVGDILVIEEDDDEADVQYKASTMEDLLISIDEYL